MTKEQFRLTYGGKDLTLEMILKRIEEKINEILFFIDLICEKVNCLEVLENEVVKEVGRDGS